MRFAVSSDTLKTIAHRMGVFAPALPLATRLEVLSRTFGFRDWYEAQQASVAGSDFPLPGSGTDFVGALWLDPRSVHQRLLLQFHEALYNLVGESSSMGGDASKHIWRLSRILTAMGVTQVGPQMPRALCLPPAAKRASALYKRMAHDLFMDWAPVGLLETAEIYCSHAVSVEGFEPAAMCLDAGEYGDWGAQRLTANSVERLTQELALCPAQHVTHGPATRTAQHTVLLVAGTNGSRQFDAPSARSQPAANVGACLLSAQLETQMQAEVATLTITVRACLSQSSEMLFTLTSAASALVTCLLEEVLATRMGAEPLELDVVLQGELRSEQAPAARERQAMREVLEGVRELCADEFDGFVTDSLDYCGLYFHPLAQRWCTRKPFLAEQGALPTPGRTIF